MGRWLAGMFLLAASISSADTIEVLRPIVKPGGIVIACSVEYADVLRVALANYKPTNESERMLTVLSWDKSCRSSEYDLSGEQGDELHISFREVVGAKRFSGRQFVLIAPATESAKKMCDKLATSTRGICLTTVPKSS